MKDSLHLYSIMPLDTDHLDEVCEDIKNQYETGVSNFPLFMMTLVPEGNPPEDKVGSYCAKYRLFKEKLDKSGIPTGILVQATIGHGWVLGEMFPYQQYLNLRDGAYSNTVCPYDKDFHGYLYNVFRTIAQHKPKTVMVDDDFRLMGRRAMGCACPLHMTEFNKRAGTKLTREELFAILSDKTNPDRERLGSIFESTQHDSLIEAAKVMREGMDSVDPTLPASFCCVGNSTEYADEIAKILAGKGNPTVVRINNGHYSKEAIKDITRPFIRAAHQIAKLKGKVDYILAETDTCPQNRYSTGALQLHSHFTGTILEGTKGAKHWITRLSSHEPESGKAYRRVLAKNRGFYEELASIVPTLNWRGFRIPVTGKVTPFYTGINDVSADGWRKCVLEVLGLPMYFASETGGVLCLDGEADRIFTDEEMKEALCGTVMLASDTAERLIKRGFGEYLGVNVREWKGKPLNGETLRVNQNSVSVQKNAKELVPLSDKVEVSSAVYNTNDNIHRTELFPGTTVYKNALGGTAIVFCGTPQTNYSISEAYSFLNYSRKLQLLGILKNAGELPFCCPSDEEMYVRAADMPDGGLFASVFNLGFDPIDKLEIMCDREVSRIEKLMPNGERTEVAFNKCGERLVLDCPCYTLDPVILFIH